MKWVRLGAYWIGAPLIALGLLIRLRYVWSPHSERHVLY